MSQFLHVFAASSKVVKPEDVAEAADEAWTGEGDVRFETPTGPDQLLAIWLPGRNRPVIVYVDRDPDGVVETVEEQLEEHDEASPEITGRLRETRQVISIEVFPDTMDSDSWEMVDVVEASLARQFDGLVVTSDGIYDAALQRVAP